MAAHSLPAAVFFLAITQAPAAAVHLVERPAVRVGAATARLLWCGRTLVAGAPRLPRDAEFALALAVASLRIHEARS